MKVTVMKDHLVGVYEYNLDETGVSWEWTYDSHTGPVEPTLTARARDDDGELYYTLRVEGLPSDDAQELALGDLLDTLGRHAGVTDIRFDGRHDLDVG